MTQPPIMESKITPPTSVLNKFKFYCDRYGIIHSFCSIVGRKHPWFWKMSGSLVTRNYLQKSFETNNELTLNLGGGSNINEKYLTGDIDPRADIYIDITSPLPLQNNSVSNIMLEEVIEHISCAQAKGLLDECHRILKPKGCIRIITPNLAYYANTVIDGNDGDEINDVFYGHGHKYIYTKEKLKSLVLSANYIDLVFTNYLDPESQLGHLDSHPYRFNHAPEISQYLEAYKK